MLLQPQNFTQLCDERISGPSIQLLIEYILLKGLTFSFKVFLNLNQQIII